MVQPPLLKSTPQLIFRGDEFAIQQFDPKWTLPSFAEKSVEGRGEWSGGRFAGHAARSPRNCLRRWMDSAFQRIGKTDRERDGRSGSKVMTEDRFLRRLRKKARKGLRGWPIATIAFYGPNLSQATKVVVGITPSENAEVEELRDWKVDHGDVRADPVIAREILEFIENYRVLSVAMTDAIIGCPHQEGIDYEGEWCPVCEFWRGRDRFTGQRVH